MLNTSLAWRMSSIFTPKRPIRSTRWSASIKPDPPHRRDAPADLGWLQRYDCEYKRNGTANLFVFLAAHRPWRHVKVTDSRAAVARPHRRPGPRLSREIIPKCLGSALYSIEAHRNGGRRYKPAD
jgi:hypothetical protein